MLYLLGNPEVLTVSGATYQKLDMYADRRTSSRYNVEELGMGLVRLAGGITFCWDEAWAIHSEDPNSDYIYGAKGGLRVDPLTFFNTMADLRWPLPSTSRAPSHAGSAATPQRLLR